MGEITPQRKDISFSHNRRIVISRQRNVTVVKLLEYIDDLRAHGVEITFNQDGTIHVSGFGYGFASPVNMFQSMGSWHWGTINVYERFEIDRDVDCDDLAYLIRDVVHGLREPIVNEFVKEFIKGYSMHGRKICAKIYFETE